VIACCCQQCSNSIASIGTLTVCCRKQRFTCVPGLMTGVCGAERQLLLHADGGGDVDHVEPAAALLQHVF